MADFTQTQIAKMLNLSQSTVSLVLADPMTKRVSEQTRKRIFTCIKQTDPSFRPKCRNTGDICYLTPSSRCCNDSIYTRLLDGAEAEAKELGLNLIFKRWQTIDDFKSLFADSSISGIIHCGETTEDAVRRLQQFAPTVLLNHTFENMVCSMVTIDNHGAIRQAVRHCYNMGHRRIGFATHRLNCSPGHFLDRVGGYYEAIHTLGLPVKSEYLIELGEVDGNEEALEHLLSPFFKKSDRPTAIVCANDGMAIMIMKAATAAGLKLPDDLSVTGFDNTETGRQWQPTLTTIHQKREDMGRAAVALLARKIRSEGTDVPEKVLCETELIVRESVARISS